MASRAITYCSLTLYNAAYWGDKLAKFRRNLKPLAERTANKTQHLKQNYFCTFSLILSNFQFLQFQLFSSSYLHVLPFTHTHTRARFRFRWCCLSFSSFRLPLPRFCSLSSFSSSTSFKWCPFWEIIKTELYDVADIKTMLLYDLQHCAFWKWFW